MKMFPGFPVLFPPCSQSFPGESVRSRRSAFPAATHMDVVPSISNYIQQPGTLRTLGTGLKRNGFGFELGSAHMWNRRGTTGNSRPKEDVCARRGEVISRVMSRGDGCVLLCELQPADQNRASAVIKNLV
jgi:hypothetical protein